jgi:hypothetical protein
MEFRKLVRLIVPIFFERIWSTFKVLLSLFRSDSQKQQAYNGKDQVGDPHSQ